MTFAQFVGGGTQGIVGVLNTIVMPGLMTLAFFAFVYGVARYIMQGDSDSKRIEGRNFILWGAIGLAVLVSTWAIVNIMLSTLGILPR
jgi:hypothetical protein